MITHLDHIALVVPDLDEAHARYTALLGRPITWRGADGGAHQVWFDLDNTALDIVSPAGEGPSGDNIRSVLSAKGEGIWALAFATDDMAAERHRLGRVGVKCTEAFSVKTTHPDTGDKRRWLTAVIDQKAMHGVGAFLIEQRPDAPTHPPAPVDGEPAAAITGVDHVVIRTPNPERAAALYGARFGLDLRLDRTSPEWGTRFLFFRLGEMVLEVVHDLKAGVSDGPDSVWGITWRTPDADAARARLAAAGFDVSDVRAGRKPGTRVFTVRDAPAKVPTLILSQDPAA